MEKIMKTSKSVCSILRTLYYSTIVLAFCISIFLFSGFFQNEPVVNLSIPLGNYSLRLKQWYFTQQCRPLILLAIADLVVGAVFYCYIIRILQAIFEPMSRGVPFTATVSNALKKLSYVVLVSGIVSLILQAVSNSVYYQFFDVPSLLNSDLVASCSIEFVGDGTFIVWFFLLRLVSYIFGYGEKLQQLSDETL